MVTRIREVRLYFLPIFMQREGITVIYLIAAKTKKKIVDTKYAQCSTTFVALKTAMRKL